MSDVRIPVCVNTSLGEDLKAFCFRRLTNACSCDVKDRKGHKISAFMDGYSVVFNCHGLAGLCRLRWAIQNCPRVSCRDPEVIDAISYKIADEIIRTQKFCLLCHDNPVEGGEYICSDCQLKASETLNPRLK